MEACSSNEVNFFCNKFVNPTNCFSQWRAPISFILACQRETPRCWAIVRQLYFGVENPHFPDVPDRVGYGVQQKLGFSRLCRWRRCHSKHCGTAFRCVYIAPSSDANLQRHRRGVALNSQCCQGIFPHRSFDTLCVHLFRERLTMPKNCMGVATDSPAWWHKQIW